MRAPELRELAHLPQKEALRRYFAGRNWAAARIVFFVVTGLDAVQVVSLLFSRAVSASWVPAAANLVALLGLGWWSRQPSFERRFPVVLPVALGLQIAYSIGFLDVAASGAPAWGLILAIVSLMAFRLRWSESAALGAVVLVAYCLRFGWQQQPFGTMLQRLWPLALALAVSAGIGLLFTHWQAARFLPDWLQEAARERERLRLKDELEAARAVQLAMLPASAPALDWLEVASASLPATEVGGDYYDYLTLADGHWALAVGDVAGHGMASGLVLSGVRAGLLLLRPELVEPERVVRRLNESVRDFGRRRLLMTLILALWDRGRRSVRLVNAGHLPPLRWHPGERRVEAVELPSPPLGTRLPPRFAEREVAVQDGEVWLFYSDGLIEARNPAGEAFGQERLGAALGDEAQSGRSLAEVCAALVARALAHRGGAESEDDQTVVLVRVRAATASASA